MMTMSKREFMVASAGVATLALSLPQRTEAISIPTLLIPSQLDGRVSTKGLMDKTPVTLERRYRLAEGAAILGSEHVSFVRTDNGVLKGYTRMDRQLVGGTLPDQAAARRFAVAFLQANASDLLQRYEVNWVKRHDENIHAGAAKQIVSGMKVKCRNLTDGSYFWVIIGREGQLVTFERDIVWDFSGGGRQTEKWLHDTWLRDRNTSWS
jgi:hypothetical protein